MIMLAEIGFGNHLFSDFYCFQRILALFIIQIKTLRLMLMKGAILSSWSSVYYQNYS